MVKVLFLSLDGYSGWLPIGEEVIELPDFSEKSICDHFFEGDFSSFEEIEEEIGSNISCFDHSITINGEESGTMYILLETN